MFWKADLDIDCDGRPGPRCNRRTDPYFAAATAYSQSDGRPLDAERLPYIVVPAPSAIWDHRDHGVRRRFGRGRRATATGCSTRSSATPARGTSSARRPTPTAKALGIRPDPHGGGAASGVTYIVFKDTRVPPIEDHAAAVTEGERAGQAVRRRELGE